MFAFEFFVEDEENKRRAIGGDVRGVLFGGRGRLVKAWKALPPEDQRSYEIEAVGQAAPAILPPPAHAMLDRGASPAAVTDLAVPAAHHFVHLDNPHAWATPAADGTCDMIAVPAGLARGVMTNTLAVSH